jgi:hypothetical protein
VAEHVLRGQIAIYPRQEGGRQFLIQDSGEIYRIPLDEKNVERIMEDLGMTDADLEAEIERRATQARVRAQMGQDLASPPEIVIPNGRMQ